MEERFIELEMKVANLENLLDQLNSIIYEQQKQIDKMERIMIDLERNNLLEIGQHSVKPPHY